MKQRMFVAHTEGERRSTLAGVNLFFGALLGAHLGTMDQIPLREYIFLVVLLAGAVIGILMIAGSARKRVIWTTVLLYAAIFGAVLLIPDLQPANMENEIQRIVAMLAVWLAMMVTVRFTPVVPETGVEAVAGPPPQDDDEA